MILTPQAQFLFRLLESGKDVTIDTIAVNMSGSRALEWSKRYAQQRVGNRVNVLNKQLERNGQTLRVRPGVARGTYRLTTEA